MRKRERRIKPDEVLKMMYATFPPETFHSRVLLFYVSKAKSFEHLRIGEGHLCERFNDTAIKSRFLTQATSTRQ